MLPKNKIFYCILFGCCLSALHLSRELDVHAPALSLLILNYLTCACAGLTFAWFFGKITKSERELWNPIEDKQRTQKFVILCFLQAASWVFGRISRAFAKDIQENWAIDIWGAFVPLFLALFCKSLKDSSLIVTGGTSLAMTCACVLMLPETAFHAGFLANFFAVLENLAISASLFLIGELLSLDDKVRPLDILTNLCLVSPMIFFVPAIFLELPLIIEYSQRTWTSLLTKWMIDTSLLLGSSFCAIYLIDQAPVLLVAISYPLGTAIAIVLTNSLLSLFGFFLVLVTFGVHTKLVTEIDKEITEERLNQIAEVVDQEELNESSESDEWSTDDEEMQEIVS